MNEPNYSEYFVNDEQFMSLEEAKDYIAFIQLETNCPITRVSVGPDRLQTIMR